MPHAEECDSLLDVWAKVPLSQLGLIVQDAGTDALAEAGIDALAVLTFAALAERLLADAADHARAVMSRKARATDEEKAMVFKEVMQRQETRIRELEAQLAEKQEGSGRIKRWPF